VTGHELAKILLDMPDVPVRVHVGERTWPDDLDVDPDDITVEHGGDGTDYVQVFPI
jgi:hypothetical protein